MSKVNYKRLGDYIREVDVRNEGLKVTNLLGLTINKEFIRSVANTIGTDMEKYKIIRKNQFACSTMQVRRDGKMPIALLKEEEAIISQAYPVFEVIDEKELLPDYLMMWFTRSEFDREACFHAVGGVRGSIEWEDFLNMQLPIPSIEKQREIVTEYNAVQKRIDLNNQLIQKLEETAQAIYKQWFVEFEFPNEEGKPYKSNGGEMVESELGEIPLGWRVGRLSEIVISTLGGDWGKESLQDNYNSKVCCIRGTDIPRISKGKKKDLPVRYILSKNETQRILKPKDIVIELSGGSPTQSTGRSAYVHNLFLNYVNQKLICSNFCRVVRTKEGFAEYVFSSIINMYNNNVFFRYENSSNGVKNLDIDGVFKDEIVVIPTNELLKKHSILFDKYHSLVMAFGKEFEKLNELQSLLLSKMARVEE